MSVTIEEAAVIVAEPEAETEWSSVPFYAKLNEYKGDIGNNYLSWHATLQNKFLLHPCVKHMVSLYKPKDFFQLALEYPHPSEIDPSRVAYTRNETDGEKDRQLVTSIGKYLSRHWPHVPDHHRRDAQALFTPDRMYVAHTTAEIIEAIEFGPRSCMASVYGSVPFSTRDRDNMARWLENPVTAPTPPWDKHPYYCYAPEYGWGIAIRRGSTGTIDGRAITLDYKGKKLYVRTYRRHPTQIDGWSDVDHLLTAWLKHNNYVYCDYWPVGATLRTFEDNEGSGRIFMPYIDGDNRSVLFNSSTRTAMIATRDNRSHWCENTSGWVEENDWSNDDEYEEESGSERCHCCDDYFYPEAMTWTGRHGDNHVCDGCMDNHYVEVRGASTNPRGYKCYYVHQDFAQEVLGGDYWFDTNHIPDCVTRLHDGDYADHEDAVEIDGEYYWHDDIRIVRLTEANPDTGDEHGLRDDCYCGPNNDWYASEEHYQDYNGLTEVEEEEIEKVLA